jgi:hypothetical protein
MGLGGALLIAVGGLVVFMNTVTTRRLWASPIFETSQKVAQTVLIWLVPGSMAVVWNILREPRPGNESDVTVGGAALVVDWVLASQANAGHHGGAGGHHAGWADGGHHGDGGHSGVGGHDGGGAFGGDGGGGGFGGHSG